MLDFVPQPNLRGDAIALVARTRYLGRLFNGYQLKAGQERREKKERKLRHSSRYHIENLSQYRHKTTREALLCDTSS